MTTLCTAGQIGVKRERLEVVSPWKAQKSKMRDGSGLYVPGVKQLEGKRRNWHESRSRGAVGRVMDQTLVIRKRDRQGGFSGLQHWRGR